MDQLDKDDALGGQFPERPSLLPLRAYSKGPGCWPWLAQTCLARHPCAGQLRPQQADPGVHPPEPSPGALSLYPTTAFLTQGAIFNWVLGLDTFQTPSFPSSLSRPLTKEPQLTRKKAKSTHTPPDTPPSGGGSLGLRGPNLEQAPASRHWRAQAQSTLLRRECGTRPVLRTEMRGALLPPGPLPPLH